MSRDSKLPEPTMQQLVEVGFNAWGLQLFVESIANVQKSQPFEPFTFRFRGIKITLEQDGDIDTTHH